MCRRCLAIGCVVAIAACGPIDSEDAATDSVRGALEYSDEATFVADNPSAIGPLSAGFEEPISAPPLTFTAGPGVSGIAVGNVTGNPLPTDLVVEGVSYSNIDVAIDEPYAVGFGMTVSSYTAPGSAGESTFELTLLADGASVGTGNFTAPASGDVFYGITVSSVFDAVQIRETSGGPQNKTAAGGPDDREYFGLFYVVPGVVPVTIDIKPGSDPNSINCHNYRGVIAVAILSTDGDEGAVDFDATDVDHTTVTFEGAAETHVDHRSGVARRHEEDVDGDGDVDLVFHFRRGETELTCDSVEGVLTGETFDGQAIEGSDAVRMVDAGGGSAP